MAGSLSALMTAGADAFTNLWDVKFVLPTSVSSHAPWAKGREGTWSVRVQDFKPKEATPAPYPTEYKGVQFSRTGSKLELERTLEFTFRVDGGYEIMKALRAWKHVWFDPSSDGNMRFGMYSSPTDHPELYGHIEVVGYQGTALTTLSDISGDPNVTAQAGITYIYEDVVCTQAGEVNFSRSDSKEVTVTASFLFGRFTEPFGSSVNPPTLK